jgi:hypothetical protein
LGVVGLGYWGPNLLRVLSGLESVETGDIHLPKIETLEPLALELRDWVRAMETGSRMPGHMLLAKRVVRLTEAAEESLRRGGDAVAFHPSGRFESLDSELPACVPGSRD